MSAEPHNRLNRDAAKPAGDTFVGIPIGELGWFTCLLMGTAAGFATFFAATFLAIVTFLILNAAGHHLNYNLTYRRIGLPAGVLVGGVSLAYLAFSWTRRQITRR